MTKEEAKKQFDEMTDKYDLVHTFSFDEVWDFLDYKRSLSNVKEPDFSILPEYTKEQFRDGIMKFEKKFNKSSIAHKKSELNVYNPLRHFFADGCYIREIFNPAGELVITAIHKVAHPFFLMKGTMSILTEEGEQRISAPYYSITKPGTKRIIYAHTDCIFVTVHATDKTDIKEIENDIITEDYRDLI
tara:strand:- start:134 stop:697 length:564 start_codon:yes stop_codon:yes gene_type:complete